MSSVLQSFSKLRVRQEGAWCELDVQSTACIEILLPAQVAVARRDDGLPLAGYQVCGGVGM